jgi:hypothetical protein
MSIAKTVEEIVGEQPMVAMALEEGIVNYSACAEYIKDTVERKEGRKVSNESILMALRRLSLLHYRNLTPEIRRAAARSSYSIHSGISDLIIDYQLATLKKIVLATSEKGMHDGAFTFIIGTKYASLVTDRTEIVDHLEKSKEVDVVKRIDGLVIFRIIIHKDDVKLPGLVSLFVREFAKAGISLVEVESTYTEIGLVIDEKDVKKAIDAYLALKERMR